jgi:hypothetical protein
MNDGGRMNKRSLYIVCVIPAICGCGPSEDNVDRLLTDEIKPGPAAITVEELGPSAIIVGPVALHSFELVEEGARLSSSGEDGSLPSARGTYWTLRYVVTNALPRPAIASPILRLVDDRGKEWSCAWPACEGSVLASVPALGKRTEEMVFDLPRGRTPVHVMAHGARAEGDPVVGTWVTGLQPPKRASSRKRPADRNR